MEPIQWTLSETFQFPASYGKATAADDVKVTAGYTEHLTEDAVRLSGIYHIAANVQFEGEGQELAAESDSIVIDDVDLEGGQGYFEYAVPLLVDFPASDEGEVVAAVIDASATATDEGGLTVMWTVEASLQAAETPVAESNPEPAAAAAAEGLTEQAADETTQQSENDSAVAVHEEDIDSSSLEFTSATSESRSESELLAFVADLEDGISVTTFQLNDVLVK